MHIIKTNWLNYENATSQKATFESNNSYLMKTLNTYLNFMQDRGKYKNGGYINRLGLFASTLCKNILATDFSIINYIYLTIGKLPEGVTMFISPIIGLFLFCVLFPINFFYSFYFITEIFKDDNGTEWLKDKKSILTNIFFYLIHFMSMFFFGWLPPLIIVCCLTFFNTFYAIFLPLIASYKDNSQKSKNLMNFISDTLYYKQNFFMVLFTYQLFSNTQTYLGQSYIVSLLFAVIIAYFFGYFNNAGTTTNMSGGGKRRK